MPDTGRIELGQLGESLAAEFLVNKGFVLLERNLHLHLGEIDLLMQDGEVIVLIEVKTQRSAKLLDPIYKISPAKQKKLWHLARVIAARYPNRNIRVDAVTLYWSQPETSPHIIHRENIISS